MDADKKSDKILNSIVSAKAMQSFLKVMFLVNFETFACKI